MADYILSNNNRYYAVIEGSYGTVPAIAVSQRVPGVRLAVATQKVAAKRRDKTGTRTFLGLGGRPRKVIAYEFETCVMAEGTGALPPAAGTLVEAALGGTAKETSAQVATVSNGGAQVDFAMPHGLAEGNALNAGGELRFVESVPSATSVRLCAPVTKSTGTVAIYPAVSYAPAAKLPSLSLFDYWDPQGSVQRLVRGAGVEEMELRVDGLEHSLVFRGPAAEQMDSTSFQPRAGLAAFPPEPAAETADWAPVPGNLGQAWLGNSKSQVLTLTKARIRVKNNLQIRDFEFGSDYPLALSPGQRQVDVQFEVYSTDQSVFSELYQAAQTETAIPLTIQLGEGPGAMAAIWLKTFIPQVPQFDDSEARLLWNFSSSPAQGTGDDEIYFAFG